MLWYNYVPLEFPIINFIGHLQALLDLRLMDCRYHETDTAQQRQRRPNGTPIPFEDQVVHAPSQT